MVIVAYHQASTSGIEQIYLILSYHGNVQEDVEEQILRREHFT